MINHRIFKAILLQKHAESGFLGKSMSFGFGKKAFCQP